MNLIPSIHRQPEPSLRRSLLGWIMRRANRVPSHQWYGMKPRLIAYYGEPDGFDLQTVEAQCWRCEGEGCDDCDYNGIHHTTRTVLHRYRVGSNIFHQPGKRWHVEDFARLRAQPNFRQHITARVKHRPTDPRTAHEYIGLIFLITGYYRQWWYFIRSLRFDYMRPSLRHPQHFLGYYLGRAELRIIRLREHIDPAYGPVPF